MNDPLTPEHSRDTAARRHVLLERARTAALRLPPEVFTRNADGSFPPFGSSYPRTVTVADAAAVLNNHGRNGREEDRALARGMVARLVLEAQQRNPGSAVFGVFTRDFGESVDEIEDLNFADFAGISLLRILRYDPRGLSDWPEEDRNLLEEGIRRAAAASARRDVREGYTNVALMSIHLLLGAGRLLGDSALRSAGEEKLQRFLRFFRTTGGFEEYNSPCYAGIDLNALVAMADFEKETDAAGDASFLLRSFLAHLSRHFHYPSLELGGPHSRAYSSSLSEHSVLPAYLFSAGVWPEEVELPPGAPYPSFEPGLVIPPDLMDAFTSGFDEPSQTRELVEWTGRDVSLPAPAGEVPRFRLITTYRHRDYVAGSVNEMDIWHQRRNLVAHWRDEDGRTTGLRLEVCIESRELEEEFEYGIWPLQMGIENAFVQQGPDILGCLYPADVVPARNGDVLAAPSAFMKPGFEDALLPRQPVAWLLGTHWRQPVEKTDQRVRVELIEAALVPIGGGEWRHEAGDAFVFRSGGVSAGVRTIGGCRINYGRLVLLSLKNLEWDWLNPPEFFVPFALSLAAGEGGPPGPVTAARRADSFEVSCGGLTILRTGCPAPDRIEERTWRGFCAGKEILPEIPRVPAGGN